MQGTEETRGGERRHPHHRHHHDSGERWARHMRSGTWFDKPWPGRRARRGDVRASILALLDEKPAHGYDLIQELQERSGGMWQPSPGSVYPTLQMLEEQGLVTSVEEDGKRVYSITDTGRVELAERRSRDATAPWEMGAEGGDRYAKLWAAMSQLGGAVMQVARGGSTDQVERVAEIVGEARKKIYAILAED